MGFSEVMNVLLLLGVAGAIFFVCWVLLLTARAVRQQLVLSSIPLAAGSRWFVGHTHLISHEQVDGYRQALKDPRSRRIVRLKLGPIHWVGLWHPETAGVILKTGEPKDLTYLSNVFQPWLGQSLGFSNGQRWAHTRRFTTKAFHADILRSYGPVYASATQVMFDKWSNAAQIGELVDATRASKLLMFDIILRCAFGLELEPQTKPCDYLSWIEELSALTWSRIVDTPIFLLSDTLYNLFGSGKRYLELCAKAKDFGEKVVAERRHALEGGEDSLEAGQTSKHPIFIDILLGLSKNDSGEGLTDEQIRDEVGSLLFGGLDSTSKTLQWTLYMLAKHLRVAQKCREEVYRVVGDSDAIDHDMIHKFLYIEQVIRETIRFIGISPGTARRLEKDYEIDGYTIPKGTMVQVITKNDDCIKREERKRIKRTDIWGLNPATVATGQPNRRDVGRSDR